MKYRRTTSSKYNVKFSGTHEFHLALAIVKTQIQLSLLRLAKVSSASVQFVFDHIFSSLYLTLFLRFVYNLHDNTDNIYEESDGQS